MTTLSPSERQYIIAGLAHAETPTRADGRGLLEPRTIATRYGTSPAANGSATVKVGATEVHAGVKLEVGELAAASAAAGAGRNVCGGRVEVDVSPQAFPNATSQALQHLSAEYAALLLEHFLPSVPAMRITERKAFVPTLHLSVIAADGGLPAALVLAARAAFADLEVPRTKVVGWEGGDDARAHGDADTAGIKGAIGARKGAGKARARGQDDWDLDLEDGGIMPLPARDTLPVLVTLNLVSGSDAVFLDATPQEEEACLGRVHAFFRPNGRICGLRLEGDEGIDAGRTRPLLEEAQRIACELAAALNADLP